MVRDWNCLNLHNLEAMFEGEMEVFSCGGSIRERINTLDNLSALINTIKLNLQKQGTIGGFGSEPDLNFKVRGTEVKK
jgi:hypothetical protein